MATLAEHSSRHRYRQPPARLPDCATSRPVYRPRRPTSTPLYPLLRVRTALERLRDEGQDNLTELALDLGFYDHSHFTHVSRQEVASIPSVWCQQRRNS